MPIERIIQRTLRHLGWDVRRYRHAHIEPRILRQVLEFSGARTVLDVGANIGDYGEMVFGTGFDGSVISFEAIPAVHASLAARARQKGPAWAVAPCAALGSKRGTICINVSENILSSSILPMRSTHLTAAPQSQYVDRQTVAIERLDELAAPLIPPEGGILIKVDTQGYEKEVLEGATGLLDRTVAMQLELSLVPLYESAPSFVEMIDYLRDRGFALFNLLPGFKDPSTGRLLQADGFFVREELKIAAD
jgi:FkbM family methyltransferase